MRVARRNRWRVQIWVIWTLKVCKSIKHDKLANIISWSNMIYTRLHSQNKLNIHLFHQAIWSDKFMTLICCHNVTTCFLVELSKWTCTQLTSDDFQEPKWFKFNDDSVSIVDLEQAETSAAVGRNYLLMRFLVRFFNPFYIVLEWLCRMLLVIHCCRNYQRSPNSNLVWHGWEELGVLSFRLCLNGDRSAKIEPC